MALPRVVGTSRAEYRCRGSPGATALHYSMASESQAFYGPFESAGTAAQSEAVFPGSPSNALAPAAAERFPLQLRHFSL
eukprot:Skav209526  [mRNA]  locus=scaffold2767:367965:369507:- [translate_table: standard]